MQTETITHIRYPKSRKHFFTNFVISQWFVKKVEEVKAEGKPARIKRYAAMNPDEMVLEPPIIFDNPNKRFRSCIVDRQAGTLLVDQLVPQVDFATFIEKSNKSDKINLNGDYNQETIAVAKAGIILEDIIAISNDGARLSKDPIFHLTKEKDTENYIILFDHTEDDPTFDEMVSWIFNDYTFENIKMEVLEEGDPGFPTGAQNSLADFYSGKVTLEDKLLIEQSIIFNLINLREIIKPTPVK